VPDHTPTPSLPYRLSTIIWRAVVISFAVAFAAIPSWRRLVVEVWVAGRAFAKKLLGLRAASTTMPTSCARPVLRGCRS
jgi:hypothetical protein